MFTGRKSTTASPPRTPRWRSIRRLPRRIARWPAGSRKKDGAPKPRPDGILRLLAGWKAVPADAVMIGNHRIDLEAGRAAGITTVHVDPSGTFEWSEHADLEVESLRDMLALLE